MSHCLKEVSIMKTEITLTKKQKEVLKQYGLNEKKLKGISCGQYDQGETIMEEGSPLRSLMIITSGEVRVSTGASNGKNLILCYYVSSGILGDMEFLTDHPDVYNQVSANSDDVEVIDIPYLLNQSYLMDNLSFIRTLANGTAEKLVQSSRDYAGNALLSAEQRLSRYILHASRHGRFSEVMSDVAMSVGISYRHMYRILHALCQKNILKKQTWGYEILDEEALKKEAQD